MFSWTEFNRMKIRNRKLETQIFHKIQVVTSLYLQSDKFEVDKHCFDAENNFQPSIAKQL